MDADKSRGEMTNDLSKVQSKLWTDSNHVDSKIRGFTPLPIGLKNAQCLKCGSSNVCGVLITPSADEFDPNILCTDCGYWWD